MTACCSIESIQMRLSPLVPKEESWKSFKPGLQYTQETGAKPRDFARTQAKKCLQSMRVCLQNFPVCVTSQLVVQTTKESDHSFTVEFTTHKCTGTEKIKMALACKKKDRIGFSFFVRCFVCGSLLSSFFLFLIFLQIAIAAKMIAELRNMQYLDFKIRYEVVRAPSPWKLNYLKNKRAVFTRKTTTKVQKKEEDEG